MFSLLQIAYVVSLRRIISNLQLEMILFLGILLAVALMSSSILFSNLLSEAALRRSLDQASPEEANFSIRVYGDLDDPSSVLVPASTYRSNLEFVEHQVSQRFDPYLRDEALLLETATFFFKGRPQLELADRVRPRGKITYMSGLSPDTPGPRGAGPRVEMVRGRWPYDGPDTVVVAGREPLEVAVDVLGAELLQLDVGNVMEVFPAARAGETSPTDVRIVGVFRRVDPSDEFWYQAGRAFSIKADRWNTVPLFTTEEAVLERVGSSYPGLYIDLSWVFFLDREGIRARDVDVIQDSVRGVRHDVRTNLKNSSITIKLGDILDDYEEQLLLARIPLFLVIFLITGMLIYYLGLLAGLNVRSRVTEISMLKSRGATTSQIGLLALVEGLLLAVPGVILGPILALGVSSVLSRAFFDGSSGSGQLTSGLSLEIFLLGMGGAVLAIAVLTISTLVASRQGMVDLQHERARPPRAPFIHRYYLDLLALALIGLIWWQIQSRDSFLVRPLGTGELEIDYSLMLGPVLGLLALGLLVLRLFPIGMALLARAAEPLGSASLVQGLRRVSRDPIMPGTLIVLLMLTTALGVIGGAFGSTLERGHRERALYAAGADLRIEHNGKREPTLLLGLADLPDEVDGVEGAAEVRRDTASLLTRGISTSMVSILAVDVNNFHHVAWYRPDFAGGKSLEELIQPIGPSPAFPSPRRDGITLPDNATGLALWVHPDRPHPQSSLTARLQDAEGRYFDVPVGELGFKGWQRLEVELSPIPLRRPSGSTPGASASQAPGLTPPLNLLSLQVTSRRAFTEPGALFLGELAVLTPGGAQLLTDFQTPDGWHVVEDSLKPGLYALESSESVARNGTQRSTAFSWAPGGIGLRGIRAGLPDMPIPALASSGLLDLADARPGDTLTMGAATSSFPIQIVGVAEYFPTLDPNDRPFVVVDLSAFTHYKNLHNQRLSGGSNELWVSFGNQGRQPEAPDAPQETASALVEALGGRGISVREAHLASEEVSLSVDRPLVKAGWGGLLVLLFLALVLASASGVVLFCYIDTRERRMEFALLRTLGLSSWQLRGVVWFNLLIVVVCGIGVGTWAGQQIGSSLLPLIDVAEGGVRVAPPMVLETNWKALLISYGVLAGVTVGTAAWLARLCATLRLHQVLRFGEA